MSRRLFTAFALSLFLLSCKGESTIPIQTRSATHEEQEISKDEILKYNLSSDGNFLKLRPIPETSSLIGFRYIKEKIENAANAEFKRRESYTEKKLVWPTYGPIYGFFSSGHTGLDISSPYGTPIQAAHDGEVAFVIYSNYGYGNHLLLASNDILTLYAHMSSVAVEGRQKVRQGEVIGRVGSTGRSRGPHLHFEVITRYVPPEGFLNREELRILERFNYPSEVQTVRNPFLYLPR